jgi:hypothetical protein
MCMLVDLNKIVDSRGRLTVIEANRHIPFGIKRIYYLYDIASAQSRGHHAHKELQQLMIAIAGQFDVVLDDGFSRTQHHLCRPDQGLLIDRMIWHEMYNFTPGSVCLLLASEYYDEADYFRNYNEFLAAVRNRS